MDLYIDIGNTNIKINFNIDGQDFFLNYETNSQYSVDTFFQVIPAEIKSAKIENAYICSVVPEKENLIKGVMKKYFKVNPVMIAYPIKTGLLIKTHDPKSVGSDLIALGAFLNSRDKDTSVIVNLGTATTIVTTKNGSLEGVIIAPGYESSLKSLINGASKLNQIVLSETEKPYGKNTQEAISIGALVGHAEMIKALVNKIEAMHIYLSGGYARIFKNILSEYEFVKEATILGMKEIIKFNHEK